MSFSNACSDPDHAALIASREPGVALCTVVAIDGAFSRRIGSQLAVLEDSCVIGDLADTCLERQLAADVRSLNRPEVRRYGNGSDLIDFRLPCGGGLDILLDPDPDHAAAHGAVAKLNARCPVSCPLPAPSPLHRRDYIPALHLRLFGEGREFSTLAELASVSGVETQALSPNDMALGRPSPLPKADAWTAVVLLFHDHEWEYALIEEALNSDAFYIGAQGGAKARAHRTEELRVRGLPDAALERLHSPVGVVPSCKTPHMLALSAFTEIMAAYEALKDG